MACVCDVVCMILPTYPKEFVSTHCSNYMQEITFVFKAVRH